MKKIKFVLIWLGILTIGFSFGAGSTMLAQERCEAIRGVDYQVEWYDSKDEPYAWCSGSVSGCRDFCANPNLPDDWVVDSDGGI